RRGGSRHAAGLERRFQDMVARAGWRVLICWPSSGTWISRVVPLPAGLLTWRVPPSASMRSLSPTSPEPWRGSAPPIPSSRIASCKIASCVSSSTLTTEPARVFGGVGQRFRDHVVGRDLDSPWQPALGVQVELDQY